MTKKQTPGPKGSGIPESEEAILSQLRCNAQSRVEAVNRLAATVPKNRQAEFYSMARTLRAQLADADNIASIAGRAAQYTSTAFWAILANNEIAASFKQSTHAQKDRNRVGAKTAAVHKALDEGADIKRTDLLAKGAKCSTQHVLKAIKSWVPREK